MQTDMMKLVIAFRDLEPAPGKMEFSDSIVRHKDSRLVGEWNPHHSLQCSLRELIITLSFLSSRDVSDQVSHPYNYSLLLYQ